MVVVDRVDPAESMTRAGLMKVRLRLSSFRDTDAWMLMR